ncbi:RagB/SusD family nutrient uptake outer membrane protein [Mucilaginibacter conchicola]|uniref:RagB/SusD family nutrient uptake outer membrane protein n=1 Tax=Mucilaginibacter conchicola TaxID=2303333 RepID=A0A372NQR5_9SPHI|nr:RagB/SusD family nutrient uptake outer membrane protein [Mucilaginibacter conchicola]RFZ90990.1 RagB/SusD family nutrient uptake outer membrane protein [Mucilaginibacter conchicola]
MKQYKILAAVGIAVLCALSACKKSFLDEKVYSKFTPEALNDSLAFEAGIIGLQSQYSLWNTMNENDNGNQGFLCVWQMGTDVAYNKAPDDLDPMAIPYTNYEKLNSADVSSAFVWKWAYNIINNANVVILNIDKGEVPVSAGFRNKIKGQAMFYRALAYNYLATLYGNVPLITEPLTAPKTDFTRTPVTQINDLIVSDLNFAKVNAPNIDDNVNKSLPNKAMASQLLAEAYLRIGGKDAEAEAECNAIINSGQFSLIQARYGIKATQPGDYFADMFIFGNQRRTQGNTEAIWVEETENPASVPNGAGPDRLDRFPGFRFTGSQHRRAWGSRYYNTPGMLLCDSLGGRGISRMALTYYVLNAYKAGDIRNSQYNLRRNYYYNDPSSPKYGQRVLPGAGIDTNRNIVPKTNKWDQFDPNDTFGSSMIKDFIIMRLGETYLLKAEAQLKQGKTGEAATTINILRDRAHAGTVSASDINMNFILDERVRELIGEENRRMTLMRTGMLAQRIQGRGLKITGVSDKIKLLPIPQSEIDLNKDAKLEQNPGY